MYPEKEDSTLELKETMSDSFLKTVSAFANYCTGRIVFGVADNGIVVGIQDTEKLRLQIENKINDTINPRPKFQLATKSVEDKEIVELDVFIGPSSPYFYNHIAYKRSDTSSTPVDPMEMHQLVYRGSELTFDQLPSPEDNLQFTVLAESLKKAVGIHTFNNDTLRTLGLMTNDHYTRGAQLLADKNQNNQSATIIVRFGKTRSEFMDRVDITNQSLLLQYQGALEMFGRWYKPYEEIVGFERISRDQLPQKAFREALANALVHRRFDVNSAVQIAMYENKIEITSPGGLPEGVSESAYLYGQISQLRNMTIAEVFHRLNIIEKFGTGIDRIREEYEPYATKPEFHITADHIRVVLPVINYQGKPQIEKLDEQILLLLTKHKILSRAMLEKNTGYKKSRVHQVLTSLIEQQKIEKVGNGPHIAYKIKQ